MMDGERIEAGEQHLRGTASPMPNAVNMALIDESSHIETAAVSAPLNGTTTNDHDSPTTEYDDEQAPRLPSSPLVLPSTPSREVEYPTSDSPVHTPEDEIVVGTKPHANAGNAASPRVTSDHEDVEMDGQVDSRSPPSHYPKRKRGSTFSDLSEDKIESTLVEEEPRPRPRATHFAGARAAGGGKGVVLGYWRDSPAPDENEKHAVIGFIDARDRLRTRIEPTNRDGKDISIKYPHPTGPGAAWVTFDKIAFDPHLVNLDHHQVKEYVKIRCETARRDESPEEKRVLNTEAVTEAMRRVQDNPPPQTSVTPSVAYGPHIPEHAPRSRRLESKRRRITSDAVLPTTSATPVPDRTQGMENASPRICRVFLGVWKHSNAISDADKHAAYGILGAKGLFRAKLVRETRDGRSMVGNFPPGPGGPWIHFDDVLLEPHLQNLSRNELKEYCRIRQDQIDMGESPNERAKNEIAAAREAQEGVPQGRNIRHEGAAAGIPEPPRPEPTQVDEGDVEESNVETTGGNQTWANSDQNIAEARRSRHSLPDVQLRSANRPRVAEHLERTNSLARQEIARAEAAQIRADQRSASRALPTATASETANKSQFQDNIQRLNKVWAAQEAERLRVGAEDAKIYMGVKYERKQNGPFQGKLVSQGTIISIDGEDYVEYRVLTKPAFF